MINTNLTGDLAWLNGRPLYASISGGKDSTALGVWLQRNGVRFTPVFLDTGWEHQATYDYIKDVLEPMLGAFTVLRNEKIFEPVVDERGHTWRGGMEALIYKKRMFPSGVVKFCTAELKVVPIQNFYAQVRYETGLKPINAVGIRAQESQKRAEMREIEEQDEATAWRPLIHWTEEQVIDLHSTNHVPPNPLYIKGASRVGCYPCIFARKHEIRHMSLADQERIEYIATLEERLNEHRASLGKEKKATFFKSRRADKEPMFINDIVEWSRNDNKGGYLDDQEEIEEEGCMRWGLCERPLPLQPSLFD